MRMRILSERALLDVSGGISIPRLPDSAMPPQQPENFRFWGPHVDRNMEYRPERDGAVEPDSQPYQYRDDEIPNYFPQQEQPASYGNDTGSYGNDAGSYGNDGGSDGGDLGGDTGGEWG